MTLDEKLQFIADRIKDEKEFFISSECDTFRFRDFRLNYVRQDRTDEYSPMSLNYILSAPLKLKPHWEFTEDEKVILRNLPDEYNWIARDDDDKTIGELFIYAFKPSKFNGTWIFDKGSVTDLDNFKHLFQSVQWSDDEPCEFRKYL